MNDRLTNEELRRAIRETLADANRSVGPLRDAAVEHLATLRMVERNRATALIAAAGGQETREPKPGEIDRYYLEEALAASEARAAELQAKLDEAARLARETAGEAMEAVRADTPVVVIPEGDWRRLVEFARSKFSESDCEAIDCTICRVDREIKAIIEKVEAANG